MESAHAHRRQNTWTPCRVLKTKLQSSRKCNPGTAHIGAPLKFKMFLVGAFPSREKCPTIAVTVFFLQTTILTLIGPLFRNNPETT